MAETAKPATVGKSPYEEVVVHPLVLLSVVDHFRRVEEVRVPRANGATPPHRAARRRRASIACHARTLHPDVHQIQLTSPLLLRRIQDDSEDKRVVGVLLGEHRKGRLDVTSSFAGTSPFRIDDAKPRACHEPGAFSAARVTPRVSRRFARSETELFRRSALTRPPPRRSALRGGRERPQHLVPGPQLPGEDVRHVPQDQRCARVPPRPLLQIGRLV
jgi:hypothetical protein